METTANAAALPSPMARSERVLDLIGCAMTIAFILLGVDLRVFAWGGQWLRAVFPVRI